MLRVWGDLIFKKFGMVNLNKIVKVNYKFWGE